MDAALITAWKTLCQTLAPAFTTPTAITFLHIATGWVLCRSKPTVTNLVRTIGDELLGHAAKHWITYEHFFYRASWSLQAVSTLLLQDVIAPLIRAHGEGGGADKPVIEIKIDDATAGRFGKHVAWAGYFKDSSASNAKGTVIHWAHNWVIGTVALRVRRWSPWVMALPTLFALYRKPRDCDAAHPFFTRQQLAGQMIQQAHEALPDWSIRVAADGQYATREMVEALPTSANLVSRIRRDAALHALPAAPRRRGRGRPRKKGKRLPTPTRMAQSPSTAWRTLTLRKGDRRVRRQVHARVCLWYGVCKDRPIKLVLVRDPAGVQQDDFFFCTDANVSDTQIIERYYARWTIEESIQEGKQFSGFDQVQGWCARTVERQAPLALIVQTLVKAWYVSHGVEAESMQPAGASRYSWMPAKSHPSYLDMLATLRQVLWRDRIKSHSLLRRMVDKILQPLQFTLCAAV